MPLWGKTDANVSKPKWLDRGQIVAVNITNPGVGYDTAPTVLISAPTSGTQATATATIANAGAAGYVNSITITNPGAGYTAADTITVSFSGGTPETPAAASAIYHGAAYNNGTIYFVDRDEAQVASNKAKGLTSPGWWLYTTYTDANGNTRHKAEHLVFIDATAAEAGDAADDSVVADS